MDNDSNTDKLTPQQVIDAIHNPKSLEMEVETDGAIHPDKSNEIKTEIYKSTDRGPYYVIVEQTDIDPIDLGLLLKRIPNINLCNLVKIAKNKVRIQAQNFSAANKLIAHQSLVGLTNYKVYLPKHYVVTAGVVRNIPAKYSVVEIKRNITSNFEIDEVERLNKWDNDQQKPIPSESIKITFRSTCVPDQIYIAYCPVKVDLYVQRPLFCKTCLSYGHLIKFCRSNTPLCGNCTQPKHDDKISCKPKCKFCPEPLNSEHRTSSVNCPTFKFQYAIKRIMALKKNTFWEAKDELLKLNPPAVKQQQIQDLSFSEILKYNSNTTSHTGSSQTSQSVPPDKLNNAKQQTTTDNHTKFIMTLANMIQASMSNGSNSEHVLHQVSNSLYNYADKNNLFTSSTERPAELTHTTFNFNDRPTSSNKGLKRTKV